MSTQHPPPLVPCRDAQADEVPAGARRLRENAEGTGWCGRTTYAHGTSTDAQGAPSRVVESVVVRLRRPPLAAVAWWWDGKFKGAYVWSLFTTPRPIGARDLSTFVKAAA